MFNKKTTQLQFKWSYVCLWTELLVDIRTSKVTVWVTSWFTVRAWISSSVVKRLFCIGGRINGRTLIVAKLWTCYSAKHYRLSKQAFGWGQHKQFLIAVRSNPLDVGGVTQHHTEETCSIQAHRRREVPNSAHSHNATRWLCTPTKHRIHMTHVANEIWSTVPFGCREDWQWFLCPSHAVCRRVAYTYASTHNYMATSKVYNSAS